MTPRSDDLRNTLDTLHLDPKAKEDRHYLVTVLRRLGYTEEEIRQAVAEPAEVVDPEVIIEEDDRAIEVEYMASSEVKEFEPVVRARPKAEEWDAQPAFVPPAPVTNAPADEVMFVEVAPAQHRAAAPAPVAGAWPEPEPAPAAEVVEPAAWPEPDAPEQLAWDTPATNEPVAWEVPDTAADNVPEAAWPEAVDEPVHGISGDEAAADVAEPAIPDGPYVYEGYTLHARDVELSTGKKQRIYFFAKGEPRSGTPAAMPDGYEVRENERTGLPFLSKLPEE